MENIFTKKYDVVLKRLITALFIPILVFITIGIAFPFSVQGQAPPPPPPPEINNPPTVPPPPPPLIDQPPVVAPPPASGLIPCVNNCGFVHLIELVKNVMDFVIKLSIPVAVGVIAWQGFILMTTGIADKKSEAKKALGKVVIGFAVILAAWLIVSTILKALLASDFLQAVPLQLSMITSFFRA